MQVQFNAKCAEVPASQFMWRVSALREERGWTGSVQYIEISLDWAPLTERLTVDVTEQRVSLDECQLQHWKQQ